MLKKLLSLIFVILTSAALAQAGDGVPPPNEGVCDELIGGTPGLYGLCVAFSEAQDCEPDFSSDDPYENCSPSDPKLLELYDKKKTETDPTMPGVAYDCPCWTDAEVNSLRYPSDSPEERAQCADDIDPRSVHHYTGLIIYSGILVPNSYGYTYHFNLDAYERDNGGHSCYMRDTCHDGNCLNIIRYLEISEQEFHTCTNQILDAAAVRGVDCIHH